MLRFAVQRPSQRRVSPHSHGTPCRDVPRRVHISIAGIGAGDAAEESLALATLRGDMPTHRTTLTRERGVDTFHPPRSLVLQTSGERRPGGIQDGPVQTGLLRHITTRLVNRAAHRADQVRHPQILDPDHVIPASNDRGGLLHEVPAPIRRAGMPSDQSSLRSFTAVGAASASRQRTRRLPDTHRRWSLIGGAIGQGQRDRDATIDTDHAAVAGTLQRCGNRRERDMPTPRGIQPHSIGLPVRQGSTAAEPYPADLRHPDPRPASVDLLYPQSLRADNPETFVPSLFAPGRPPMATGSPVGHRQREIPQRLLLHRLRARAQPLVRCPSLSQLLTLQHIVRQKLAMMPVPELLHREIPHEPGVRAVLREQHFLLSCRIQAKPHHRRLTVRPDNSGFLPTVKSGPSARDSR